MSEIRRSGGYANIVAGTIDNTVIGGTTPAAGTFTDLVTENESTMAQRSTPTALPAAGYVKIYPKSDNKLYILHPDGTEVEVGASAQAGEGLIGTAGAAGFGVGICPLANLPTGFTPLPGYNVVGHSNYGNYQFSDGSVMVFVPKFYYRVGSASSPNYATYGANALDIKGIDTYADTAAANAAGYALHRAFIDGGAEKPGFFFDKYMASKNAWARGMWPPRFSMVCLCPLLQHTIRFRASPVGRITTTAPWTFPIDGMGPTATSTLLPASTALRSSSDQPSQCWLWRTDRRQRSTGQGQPIVHGITRPIISPRASTTTKRP